ncbi:F-box/LRR-repeat protein 3-like [Vicia villosa]|uniref:F-box/LRR-repeat protein 3-like n=1 Tax=Vicia villosa TaxID=3911 RepID=UPI00273B92AE|nr:F-box/LRR-repeat protein 3-like [Vicia villosa]
MKKKRNFLKSKSTKAMAGASSSLSSIQTSSKEVATFSSNVYLLDECWECIFKFLINHDIEYSHRRYVHLKPLSIVSKQFLSVTNRLRSSLTVYNPACQFFHRFSNIASLDLSYYVGGDLDDLLVQISRFPLKITSLNISNQLKIPTKGLRVFSKNITTLTSLVCSNIATLYYTHMLFIADCFPLLQELDFSKPTHFKFDKTASFPAQALSLALPKLRKINLYGNYDISNEVLFHLCKNCKLLQEVTVIKCWRITLSDIAADLHERPTLSSLSYSASNFYPLTSSFIDSLVILKGLTSLDLFDLRISDELLSSIAMVEGLPLTRLGLRNCSGCSYSELFSLLSKCPCIQHLILESASFLNNPHIAELSLFLGDLISINLRYCNKLTESALFALVRNCPSLIEINMESTSTGKERVRNFNSSKDCIVNSQLKSLYLADCEELGDETIIRFASIFSNLQLLDLNSCPLISSEGISQVLRRGYNIRHLKLAYYSRVKLFDGMNFERPKLEVLNLSYTTVHDETLYAISKCCRGLLQLDLQNCVFVTQKGVKHVLENCTQLREINLRNCYNVRGDVCSVLLSSLSLRKIIAPSHIRFTRGTIKLFSHHGCRVC